MWWAPLIAAGVQAGGTALAAHLNKPGAPIQAKPAGYLEDPDAYFGEIEKDPYFMEQYGLLAGELPGKDTPLGMSEDWAGMGAGEGLRYLAPYASGEMSAARSAAQAERQAAQAAIAGQAGAAGYNPALQRQALMQMANLGQQSAAGTAAAVAQERLGAAEAYNRAAAQAYGAETGRRKTYSDMLQKRYQDQLGRAAMMGGLHQAYLDRGIADVERRRGQRRDYEGMRSAASIGLNPMRFGAKADFWQDKDAFRHGGGIRSERWKDWDEIARKQRVTGEGGVDDPWGGEPANKGSVMPDAMKRGGQAISEAFSKLPWARRDK